VFIYCADDEGHQSGRITADARPDISSSIRFFQLRTIRDHGSICDRERPLFCSGEFKRFFNSLPGRHMVQDAALLLRSLVDRGAGRNAPDSGKMNAVAGGWIIRSTRRRSEILVSRGDSFMATMHIIPRRFGQHLRDPGISPGAAILVDFMSHTYSRTSIFLTSSRRVLRRRTCSSCTDYASARRTNDMDVSGEDLFRLTSKNHPK